MTQVIQADLFDSSMACHASELRSLIKEFLRWCETAGKARNTVEVYYYDLKAFVRFFEEHNIPMGDELLSSYLHSLVTLKPATRRRRYYSLSKLFTWCIEQGITKDNPLKRHQPPVVIDGGPRPIPEADLHRLTAAIEELCNDRYKLMYHLLLDTGMRINEAVSIRLDDISWAEGEESILIRGKGRRRRLLPLSPEMRSFNLLREYIGTRVDGALFEGRSGGHLVREAPTVYLRRILSTLNMNYTMHQLRHTAATNWINRGGMSTLVVQDLLGHSSSIYTERYVQVREWKKRADLKAYAMANG